MIIRQFLSVLTLLAVASTVSAGVVKVDLNVGVIKPGETIVINLDKLASGIEYKLNCTLTSDHTSGKPYNLIQITTPTNSPAIGVNAEETMPGSHQYKLPATKNSYLYGNIHKEIGDISINNLDNTDSITLSGCHAVGRV